MGLFSYTCAKTHLPIMADFGDEYSRVVVVGKEGRLGSGIYDGYGRGYGGMLEDFETDDLERGAAKMVLSKFYNGETFDQLEKNGYEPGQGYFHDTESVKKWFEQGGFSSYKDYLKAYAEFDWRKHLSTQ